MDAHVDLTSKGFRLDVLDAAALRILYDCLGPTGPELVKFPQQTLSLR